MGIANFGAFLGGISQGQQQAQQQAQRAQYLQMLLDRQRKADQEKDDSDTAQFEASMQLFKPLAPGATDGGSDPGTSSAPTPVTMPGQQPMGGAAAPMPGQSSMPAAGPQPLPGAPAGTAPPQGQPVPPPGGMIPGQRPVAPIMPPQQVQPGAGATQPPQAGGSPPQAPQAPQTPDQLFAAAQGKLDKVQEQMQTPVAQKILADPDVKRAHSALDAFVAELRKDNIGTMPGQKKPSAVQMKELQLLSQQSDLAATKAAKNITADEGNQVKIGTAMASLLRQEAMMKAQLAWHSEVQDREDARKRMGGGAGGTGSTAYQKNEKSGEEGFTGQSDGAKLVDVNTALQMGPKGFGTAAGGAGRYTAAKQYAIDQLHLDPDAFSNGPAAAAAVKNALKQQTAQQAAGLAASNVAMENAGLVEQNFKKLGNTNLRTVNEIENWFKSKKGDEDLDATKQALLSFLTEYTRATNAPMSAAALHEGAMKRAMDVLNQAQTPGAFDKTLSVMKQEMSNANAGRIKAVQAIANQLPTAGTTKQAGGAAPAGGGNYRMKDGTPVAPDALAEAAKSLGMSVDDFARMKGLQSAP